MHACDMVARKSGPDVAMTATPMFPEQCAHRNGEGIRSLFVAHCSLLRGLGTWLSALSTSSNGTIGSQLTAHQFSYIPVHGAAAILLIMHAVGHSSMNPLLAR